MLRSCLLVVCLVCGCTASGTNPDGPDGGTDAGYIPVEAATSAADATAHADAGALDAGDGAAAATDDAAVARVCEEGAPVGSVTWQRVEAGLEDFVYGLDTQGRETSRGLAGAAYGNGVWLTLGDSNMTGTRIHWATSTDGVRWQHASQPTAAGRLGAHSRVFFVRGRFVFFAQHLPSAAEPRLFLFTSTDGEVWTEAEFPHADHVFDLASSDTDVVIATGPSYLWQSTDLQTWTNRRLLLSPQTAGSTQVAFGAGRWLAGIGRSVVVDGALRSEGESFGSSDGASWQSIALAGAGEFNFEYGGGVWVASNEQGDYRTSTDGQTFVEVAPTGPWNGASTSWLFRLRHAGGRFVSYAIDQQVPPRRVQLISSQDGRAWSELGEVALPLQPAGATNIQYELLDVAYADCRYVFAGRYEVLVPGALDPPAARSEIGPFLITADVARY